jgi:hypothetical protein
MGLKVKDRGYRSAEPSAGELLIAAHATALVMDLGPKTTPGA